MPDIPFFVIRNSIHNDAGVFINSENNLNFENQSDHADDEYRSKKQSHISIVRLLEAPSKGLFRLDVDSTPDNVDLVDKFLGEENDESKITYIDERSWQHLHTFATLIGKEEICRPLDEQYDLLSSQYDGAPLFTLLKDNLVDLLSDKLPLNRLFSWKVLVNARAQGDLNWKDIRLFLAKARDQVPFITNGILKSPEPVHLTLLQFVSFSKLLENHMNTLPSVVCKVLTTAATSVDILLESSHNCNVQIGTIEIEERSQPPSTQDFEHNSNLFASLKRLFVKAGSREKIKIDSLRPNTTYNNFLRVVRGAVASDDTSVQQSKLEFVTDCQPNVFPDFGSMSPEEQRIEVLACINDKVVRKAAASLIPSDIENFVSVDKCSDDWGRFISWWCCNHDIRSDFLMRELMFAASDVEIRRHAELSGISMKERKSHDPEVRQAWSKTFAAWYFDSEIPADIQSTRKKKAASTYHFSPNIQHYEFETGENEPNGLNSSASRSFINKVLRAPADCTVTAEQEGVSLFEDERARKCHTEVKEVVDMSIKSFCANTKEQTLPEPPLVLPEKDITRDRSRKQATETSKFSVGTVNTNTYVDNSKMQGSTVDGIVGARIQSQRRKLLERITKKVQEARTRAEEISGSSRELRGIELFRSKVRLVILLQKLTPSQSCSGEFGLQRSPAPITENAFDLFEFDDAMYDFDALKKNQPQANVKVPRYDCVELKEMRQRNILKAIKRSFLYWKNKQLAARNKMMANIISAELAYIKALLKRTYQKFYSNVKCLIKERIATEQENAKETTENVPCEPSEDVEVIESKFGINQTSSFEIQQMTFEDELASKFRQNCSCHVGFRIDSSFLPNPALPRSALAEIIQEEHKDFLASGIQLADPINIYDSQTLTRQKREKLKAAGTDVNIFDVPTHVLLKSYAVEDNNKQTEYRMKEKVKHLIKIS